MAKLEKYNIPTEKLLMLKIMENDSGRPNKDNSEREVVDMIWCLENDTKSKLGLCEHDDDRNHYF